jgi:hypothetical protein
MVQDGVVVDGDSMSVFLSANVTMAIKSALKSPHSERVASRNHKAGWGQLSASPLSDTAEATQSSLYPCLVPLDRNQDGAVG